MKIIQKLVIIFMFFLTYTQALEINKNYIDELLNYKVELPSHIYNPFLMPQTTQKKDNIKEIKKVVFKIEKKELKLLAILNNQALVEVFKGKKVIAEKWLKVGEEIEGYKLEKILNSTAILVSKDHKTKIISMKKKKDNNIYIKVIR